MAEEAPLVGRVVKSGHLNGLFEGTVMSIIPDDIPPQQQLELEKLILDNSGTISPLKKDGSLESVSKISHVLASSADWPEYQSTIDNGAHVVKPSWIYQSIAKGRRVAVRQHSPDPALIFQDVIITFGDLPSGDKDAITAGVLAMGGLYSSSLTKLVTHVVSLSEESEKIRIVKTMNLPTKVVLPHWFDDCLKLGKKINEGPYTLPDPEILDAGDFSVRRLQGQVNMNGATSAVAGKPPSLTPPPSTPGTPSTPRRRLNAFVDKKIFFSHDLGVHDKLAHTLKELVERSGGGITTDVMDCDVFIGHYRDGNDYITASRKRKTVANLSWFYSVIMKNRWSNPLSKLLHYPIPRDGIPGFKGMKISLSNYTGDARTYLENLIHVAGAEFTKTMRPENTHLVTAHKSSEKCDAAQEWNISIINHQWLEDSYAKCEVQNLTVPRYTHFPHKTNLSEIVGTTMINLDRVEELYFAEEDDEEGSEIEAALPPKRSPTKTVRAADKKSLENGTDNTKMRVKDGKGTPDGRRSSSKENDAPSSTARASKMKAAVELEKAMKDIAEFQKEQNRKGGVTHSKKRHVEDEKQASDLHGFNSDMEEVDAARPSKKLKSEREVDMPIVHKMLVTGDERWLKRPKRETDDRKTLRNLGIQLVTEPSQCTLLIAPKILRTRKFVTAVANAPTILHTSYLDNILKHKSLPEMSEYYLKDREGEKRLGFGLVDAQKRSKQNQHRLLRGWTIYITDKVNGGYETYADIISTNGGKPVPYRGRTGVPLPKRRLTVEEDEGAGLESQNQGGDGEVDYVYLVSGTEEEEKKMWELFRRLTEKQGLRARVVKTDWLLQLAMAQEVRWEDRWELRDNGDGD
ncbi:BRCT-containing protein 1 [Sphaceloma murrayae]|uniref:BRCT-containing protein 1 n=1 Tax=Sphaceloma murrayae TaxID=2082308 RepID=A0A2K1QY76_9PEZI|nr:BRCT-containing protein 1 [Sphaceloma murrayae]